ncbi:MAG: PepSY domain-containing protein [Candidatus Sericytochromatia bacterium]
MRAPNPQPASKTPGWSIKRLLNASHRWLGLLAFAQVLLWSLSGFLMYSLDFSDLYADPPPAPLPLSQAELTPQTLQSRLAQLHPGSKLTGLQIRNIGGQLAYQLTGTSSAPLLLDASGAALKIDSQLATRVARLGYTGQGQVRQTELLPSSAGNYFSSTPVYLVRFDDPQQTEIYIDPASGSLLARRKALWGLYNQMWEFHLMKYTPFKAVNKALLLIFAILNALVALTGFLKFFRKKPVGITEC